jgi:hypothetical protein
MLTVLFTLNEAIVLVTFTYPPFGVVTTVLWIIILFDISWNMYSAAISIAQDVKLRQSIKKFALKEDSKLLDSIRSPYTGKNIFITVRIIGATAALAGIVIIHA